jgi:hypothetical protein
MKADTFSQLSLFEERNSGEKVIVRIKAKDIAFSHTGYKVVKEQLTEMQSTVIVLKFSESKNKNGKENYTTRIEQFFVLEYPDEFSSKGEIKFIFEKHIAKLLVTIPKKQDLLRDGSKLLPYNYSKIDPSVFFIKKSLPAMSLAVLLMGWWPNKKTLSYSFKSLKDWVKEENPNTYTSISDYSIFVLKRASKILKETKDFPFYFSFTKEKKGKEMENIIFHFTLISKVEEIADAGVTIQGESANYKLMLFHMLKEDELYSLTSNELKGLENKAEEFSFSAWADLLKKFPEIDKFIRSKATEIKNPKSYMISSLQELMKKSS